MNVPSMLKAAPFAASLVGCSVYGGGGGGGGGDPAPNPESDEIGGKFVVANVSQTLMNPEVDPGVTVPSDGPKPSLDVRPGDMLTVAIPFSAPAGNVVGVGVAFGPGAPVQVVSMPDALGMASGMAQLQIQVPDSVCDDLADICHQIQCYEFAVTDIGKVSANVRAWREYEASILRLQAIEAATRAQRRAAGAMVVEPYEFPPAYEWWMENFALLRDITLRRLPARLQTYDQVLADPEATIAGVLGWIGRGDVAAAMTAVKPEHRTQLRPSSDSVAPALARVFDDLYAGVAAGKGISGALLRTLNETNLALLPELARLQAKVAQSQQMRARTTGRAPPIEIDGLPELD